MCVCVFVYLFARFVWLSLLPLQTLLCLCLYEAEEQVDERCQHQYGADGGQQRKRCPEMARVKDSWDKSLVVL